MLSGCSLVKSTKNDFTYNYQCEIVDIKEFNNTFRFTALNELLDTIFIVSTKKNFKNILIKQSDSIYLNQVYNFDVSQLKPQISAVRLGASFILGNDTILKIPSYNSHNYKNENIPKVYFAHNIIGLCKIIYINKGTEKKLINNEK
jgi:hypothetical protein